MVESTVFWVKHSSYIALDIELIKNFLVSCSHYYALTKLLGVKKHRCGHNLITMEAVTVGAHQLLLRSQLRVIQVFLSKLSFVFGANND